jgi:ferredoxin/flavodoxin---NADP+ reductase
MSETVGSETNPLRVAIVGTGPSGMFAAAALLAAKDLHVRVDLFDKLPAPFGLVRYGVAPDHQKIKKVIAVFDKAARDPRVRYFGNVALGRDLSREEMKEHYHQIIYAVGAQGDASLRIPGEDLEGSVSSTEFVNWYNCHPELADTCFYLDHESVAVIGIGNVAIDVARILGKRAEDLAVTDISDETLEELRKDKVREIWILARRGPVQAKCTPGELQELGEIEGAQVVVEPAELELDPESEKELEADRSAQKNMELFRRFASAPVDPSKRHIRIRFLVSPVELLGDDGRVSGLRIEKNALVPRDDGSIAARGTGEYETLPATMVIRAVGYRSHPIPGLPFDEWRAVVPNARGRITGEDGRWDREYVVGWVKRGPTGLIGTNKGDAKETVDTMLEEVGDLPALKREDIVELLEDRAVRYVTYEEWLQLDEYEIESGRPHGRPRVKLRRIREMLDRLGGRARSREPGARQ